MVLPRKEAKQVGVLRHGCVQGEGRGREKAGTQGNSEEDILC